MKKLTLLVCALMAGNAAAHHLRMEQLVYQIRDPKTQPAEMRKALEKMGELLAFDAMEELKTKVVSIETLTEAIATHTLVAEEPVLVTIMRAGIPLNSGVHEVFPNAEVGFIAMARNEDTLLPRIDYVALPDVHGKTVIISDTMLATGGSILAAVDIICKGAPKKIIVISAIASRSGINAVHKLDPNIRVIAGAVDPVLNERGYIVPGLGDAGDRAYGHKAFKVYEPAL